MSHQPHNFYSRASTAKRTTPRSTTRSNTGSDPLRLLNSNFEYLYLPDETVDEFNMDSPMSEGSEYGERDQPYTTTPTLTEYNDRQTRYTTPNQSPVLVNSLKIC